MRMKRMKNKRVMWVHPDAKPVIIGRTRHVGYTMNIDKKGFREFFWSCVRCEIKEKFAYDKIKESLETNTWTREGELYHSEGMYYTIMKLDKMVVDGDRFTPDGRLYWKVLRDLLRRKFGFGGWNGSKE